MAAFLFVTFVTNNRLIDFYFCTTIIKMKYSILHNWNLFRFLRLALGIAIIVQGAMARDVLFVIAGALFTLLAIFNAGCCAGSTCYNVPKKDNDTKEITYEEVV